MKRVPYTSEEDKVILSNPSNKEVGEQLGRSPGSISVRRVTLKKNNVRVKRQYVKKEVVTERISATGLDFRVNGTEITIEKGVKKVFVGKNMIEIEL
jgi:hypothetical protein